MKSILFIITLFVINVINSQTIRVKVYEVIEHYEYDTTGVIGAINTMTDVTGINDTDCEYIFDLNTKQVSYYVKGVLEDELEFVFENVNSTYIITLTSPNDDTGFVLNTDIVNESFDYFTVYSDSYKIFKAKKFDFVKGF
jgi:hypothetical protein